MPMPSTYDYAVIRVVPRVEREEFVNVGVIVSCPARDFLAARIEVDAGRLRALDPTLDVEAVLAHLATIPRLCAGGPEAGPLARLTARERFRWLTAPRSALIQCSPAHTGQCAEPNALVEHLLDTMVRVPGAVK